MRTRTFLPRPEYPRPDRRRAFKHGIDWVNLNGPWDFRFDGDRRGLDEEWFAKPKEHWSDQIIVPFCWESLAAWAEEDAAGNDHFYSLRVYRNPLEVNEFNYRSAERYEVGWYRQELVVPRNDHWAGKRVILTIGAADFFTDAWCNGVHLGHHEGGYDPIEFDLTEALAEGRGYLVLRVEDPMDNREQPVGKQWGWYTSVSGIWQTVFIEPRAATSIDTFQISTDITCGEVSFSIRTNGGSQVAMEITSPDGKTRISHTLPVRAGVSEGLIHLDSAVLWEPSNPALYQLKLELRGGDAPDIVYGYFGMRSLSAMPSEEVGAPAVLAFNGRPIYIRGALYQSYYAEGVYTAADVQTIIDDIAYAKRVGFDLLRVHIKVDDPLLLYYADTMGMLLMADIPNFGEGTNTPLARRRYEECMRAAIRRDFNHPSIIAWCLFNETWGFGGQADFIKIINPGLPEIGEEISKRTAGTKLANQSAYDWIHEIWTLAKGLDPTRLIEDMSVVAWSHLESYGHSATDINSWHFYTDDYEYARQHIEEVVRETYQGSNFNYVPGFAQETQPLMTSEYGGVGALDGDRDISWTFKFLTNELRKHGSISAYIFTELHDVEWERNGFLNYDRTPKEFGYDPRIINQGDVLPIDAPPAAEFAPEAEVEIPVYSSHFSRTHQTNVTLHWDLAGVDSFGRLRPNLASGQRPIPFSWHRVELVERIKLRLPAEPMLCTFAVRALADSGQVIARNFVHLVVKGTSESRSEGPSGLVLRPNLADWESADWSQGHGPREEAQRDGYVSGHGSGHFRWRLPVTHREVEQAQRLRLVYEASVFQEGIAQSDYASKAPTWVQVVLNGVVVGGGALPGHPHDSRGVLSYLRGLSGNHGYLLHATVEGALLDQVRNAFSDAHSELTLEFRVPEQKGVLGGLCIYGADCGRFPLGPTLMLEPR